MPFTRGSLPARSSASRKSRKVGLLPNTISDSGSPPAPSARPRLRSACNTIVAGRLGLCPAIRQAATPTPTTSSTAKTPITANSLTTKRRMALAPPGNCGQGQSYLRGLPRAKRSRSAPGMLHRGQHRRTAMDDNTRTELEAATFRALVAHLRERTDVQNIDLMNLAGFCRNCLSKWYRAAAEDKGVELSDPQAREIVYGMPYDEWRKQYQKEASADQKAAFAASQH